MRTPRRRPLQQALLLAALFLLSLPPVAGAQDRGDGTAYSRFGLGELEGLASSQVAAMGGGGYALRSLNYTGFANPALWSDQLLVRASFGARYEEVSITNAEGETSRLNEGALGSVHLSFPVLPRELGVGLAYRPYSRANYRVSAAGQLEVAPDSLVAYDVNLEGDGGLQQITGGAGYRVSDALSLGATVDVVFGIVENTRTTTFPDRLDFAPATRTDGTRLLGVTGTLGALLSLKSLLAEDDVLSIGAAFTLPTRLQGERVLTLGRSLDADTLSTRSGEADLPWQAGLGLAYKPDERWAVLLDGHYAPWSNFESTLALPGQGALSDRARVSAGTEFLPAGEDLIEPFFRRTAYRLGAYAEQTYVRVPLAAAGGGALTTSDPINTYGLTGGLSFPTLLPGTHLDLNFKVGRRGTTASGLVRDTFYGASLTVNFGERWFQQRRLR